MDRSERLLKYLTKAEVGFGVTSSDVLVPSEILKVGMLLLSVGRLQIRAIQWTDEVGEEKWTTANHSQVRTRSVDRCPIEAPRDLPLGESAEPPGKLRLANPHGSEARPAPYRWVLGKDLEN